MLHHAYYWRELEPDDGPGPVARYVKGWGRPGDTALIALEGGFPVGAAWYRLFERDAPGYGFVDEETPELAVAVVPSRRGRGIGEKLIDALCAQARDEGRAALSLAVESDNELLVTFYEKHGFARVAENGDSIAMVRPL